MPATVTEYGREERLDDYFGYRVFGVSGVANAYDALTATDEGTGLQVPQTNSQHPTKLWLYCKRPRVIDIKAPGVGGFYIVACEYGIPTDGLYGSEVSPLTKPTELEEEIVEIVEPVDIDLDDRPILNSAKDPLYGASRPISYKRRRAYKYLPQYNEEWWDIYNNTCNQNAVTLFGISYAAEHVRMTGPFIVGRVKKTSAYVQVSAIFDCVPEGLLGDHPWQHRLLNQGANGWFEDGDKMSTAPFMRFGGTQYVRSGMVRLNVVGVPLDASVKVGYGKMPRRPDYLTSENAVVPLFTESYRDAVFVGYKKTRLADWSGLSSILPW